MTNKGIPPLSVLLTIVLLTVLLPVPASTVFGSQSEPPSNEGPAANQQQPSRNSSKQASKPAASQTQQAQSSPEVVLSTSEVVLDVVARDKRGRPVQDLGASNFEVYEDGKKQQVESFQLHHAEGAPQPSSVSATSQPAPSTPASPEEDRPKMQPAPEQNPFVGINVVALVFDRLSLQGRTLAQKAAMKCVSDTFRPDDFAGIFSIDLTLRILQPFTNNRDYIAKAINRMATTERAQYTPQETAMTADANQVLADQMNGSFPEAPPAGQSVSGGPQTAAISANVIRAFQTLERNQRANVEVDSLLSIVNSMRNVEGRKAVVLFSEGLSIGSDTADRLRSVIANANAANVTFYTTDASGLRAISPTASTARSLNREAMARADSALGGSESTSGHPMTFDMEDNETLLWRDPAAALGKLANETGGFFINGTNDLVPALSKVGEDIHTYYVLTYVPRNQEYNGRYRRITVKVNRPGVEIEARKGYYAIRKPTPMIVPDWESPAMEVLRSGQVANAVAMRARVFSFPEAGKPGLVPVFVDVPASAVTYELDKDKNVYNADFSIVALFKDLSNQPVARVGKHYHVTVQPDEIDAAQRGDILFYQETDLPAGLYFIQAIAYDTTTGKSSVRTTSVEVPYSASDNVLNMSSVVVLRRAQALNEKAAKLESPFHYGGAQVYPNLGEPLSKANDKALAFYFDVYPPKKLSAELKLTVEILQDGKELTSGSPALPGPDPDGRIQYVSALPLSGFQPGEYSLKITVTEGQTSTSRVASFTVEP
jgi:VWFA-related protein